MQKYKYEYKHEYKDAYSVINMSVNTCTDMKWNEIIIHSMKMNMNIYTHITMHVKATMT